MRIINSIIMAFSMFSKIPMPMINWQKENMRYMLCAFPLVGGVTGLLVFLWWKAAAALMLGNFIFSAGVLLLPLALTGGIHVDGFADTVDALSSHASPERKREILKDPHTGAFAVIAVSAYMIAYTALISEINFDLNIALLFIPLHMLSRNMAALATLVFPSGSGSGLLATFRGSASRTSVYWLIAAAVAICAAAFMLSIFGALCLIVGAGVSFIYLCIIAKKSFGGMSGDLAGFYVQVSELLMVFCLVFLQKVVIL